MIEHAREQWREPRCIAWCDERLPDNAAGSQAAVDGHGPVTLPPVATVDDFAQFERRSVRRLVRHHAQLGLSGGRTRLIGPRAAATLICAVCWWRQIGR